jgi:phosphoribosylformylglycinamidine cyclo-ligase
MRRKGLTYAQAGVNIKEIKHIHSLIGRVISRTHNRANNGRVLSGFGHYAGLIDIGSCVLALHCDGVGTKILVAQTMKNFSTIGIDCVAMNVNDIICVGGMPIAFVDYIATASTDPKLLRKLAEGLAKGAEEAGVAIVGGETAIVPTTFSTHYEHPYLEISGTALGLVNKKSDLILGDKIRDGDIILGIESSGLHSNGFTLARKALSKYEFSENVGNLGRPLGDELLTPTRIYVKPVIEILGSGVVITGIAHVTGGSFTKLRRINSKVNYRLSTMPQPPEIFRLIQEQGKVESAEMYRTFNMGIGMCVIVPRESVEAIISVFGKYGMRAMNIGIIEKPGIGEVLCRISRKNIRL